MPGTPALAGDTPSVDGASVYIINLRDGDTVTSPVTMLFGLKGMGIAPAGVEQEGTGHHHLLINKALSGSEFDEPMVADDDLIHYGGGQTETMMELPAGTHTLQLVLGDHNHVPHEPPVMSEPITVTVK
ncbi:MAG: DUF4399 domain-containing protein [Pseudomonadota bacterium]